MTIPQQPPDQEIPSTPIDTPDEPNLDDEPGWQSPGVDEPPMRLPRENPDVETEL